MDSLIALFVILISVTIMAVLMILGLVIYKYYLENNYFRWRNPKTEPLPSPSKKVLCETTTGNLVGGYITTNDYGTAIIATDPDFHFEDYDEYRVKRWRYIK